MGLRRQDEVPGPPVVTSDPGDLTLIADSIGVKTRLFAT